MLEEQLFRPVQSAYGRAKRTYAEFAARSQLRARSFDAHSPGVQSQTVRDLIERAVDAADDADQSIAELQDSMLPVEVGDPELRAGLSQVRETLSAVPAGRASWCAPSVADGAAARREVVGCAAMRRTWLLITALAVALALSTAAAQASGGRLVAHGSVQQVYATGLTPRAALSLLNRRGRVVATQRADSLGGIVFRLVTPGRGLPSPGRPHALGRGHRDDRPLGAAEHQGL